MLKFYIKIFYVMGKALTGQLFFMKTVLVFTVFDSPVEKIVT